MVTGIELSRDAHILAGFSSHRKMRSGSQRTTTIDHLFLDLTLFSLQGGNDDSERDEREQG